MSALAAAVLFIVPFSVLLFALAWYENGLVTRAAHEREKKKTKA